MKKIIRCPKCKKSGTLQRETIKEMTCTCGANFEILESEIINFVNNTSNTLLDVDGYHEQKQVTLERSIDLFKSLQTIGKGIIPDYLESIAEIGCGTGLLTVGLLNECKIDNALITDISPQMLKICKERVESLCNYEKEKINYATYSGKEEIFEEEAYDLIIGNSVLHHVLDYNNVLSTVRKALKKNGLAIFTEPTRAFHEALTLSLADTMVGMMVEGISHQDLRALASWTQETRYRLRSAPNELVNLEDKHIFSRQELIISGAKAGFQRVEITPANYDPIGLNSVRNYQRELRISEMIQTEVLKKYEIHAEHHFKEIDKLDATEMYFIALYA